MSEYEAQCDCELDSPGVLSHLPMEERLHHWTDWALYLKGRIEKHYRSRIAALEAEVIDAKQTALSYGEDFMREVNRAAALEAELDRAVRANKDNLHDWDDERAALEAEIAELRRERDEWKWVAGHRLVGPPGDPIERERHPCTVTILRGIFASLAAPSPDAKDATDA